MLMPDLRQSLNEVTPSLPSVVKQNKTSLMTLFLSYVYSCLRLFYLKKLFQVLVNNMPKSSNIFLKQKVNSDGDEIIATNCKSFVDSEITFI